jgi:hypothetical protein
MKSPWQTKKLGEKEDLEDKSQFDRLERSWLKLIKTATQYPASILEQSESGRPLKIKPIKDKKNGLPVYIEKETLDPNILYPYQTKDLAKILNKNSNYVQHLLKVLNLKDDPKYNYNYKNSSGQIVLRKYNDECLNYLRKFLIENPNFNPWCEKL